MAKYERGNVTTGPEETWRRYGLGQGVQNPATGEKGIFTQSLMEAAKYRYGTPQQRTEVRGDYAERPLEYADPRSTSENRSFDPGFPDPIPGDVGALYANVDKTISVATMGFQNELLQAAMPYDMLPAEDPRKIDAMGTLMFQKQVKIARLSADSEKLISNIDDLQRDKTITPQQKTGIIRKLELDFQTKWVGKAATPPVGLEEEAVVVAGKMKTLADRGGEGSPPYIELRNRLRSIEDAVARRQGLVRVDIPKASRKGPNKGVSAFMPPEKAIEEYKVRNMDIPAELQAYDIGAKPQAPSRMAQAALQSPYSTGPRVTVQPPAADIKTVKTQDEYDALASGTRYRDMNGSIGIKR